MNRTRTHFWIARSCEHTANTHSFRRENEPCFRRISIHDICENKQIKIRGDQELKNDALRQSWRLLKKKKKNINLKKKKNINLKINVKINWCCNQVWNATLMSILWMNYMKFVNGDRGTLLYPWHVFWWVDRGSTSLPPIRLLMWWHRVHLYLLATVDIGCHDDDTMYISTCWLPMTPGVSYFELLSFQGKAKWFPELTIYKQDSIKLVRPSCLYSNVIESLIAYLINILDPIQVR